MKKSGKFISAIAVLMVLALCLPMGAAAAQVRASEYVDSYDGSISASGSGVIKISFSVIGTDVMYSIGALNIRLYESEDNVNFSLVKTFANTRYPGMTGSNKKSHSGQVEYQGVSGRYYKAYICFWAGEQLNGETRYYWTGVKKAI